MIEELRISSLGVIDSSTLELGPGFTVVTGETGAGKTMVVTALGLLLGGRADSGAVRVGARQARVEGVVRADRIEGLAAAVEDAGGEVEDQLVVLARNVSAEGRSRAYVGGAGVPVATLATHRRAARRRPRPVRPAPAGEGKHPARRARRLRRRRGHRPARATTRSSTNGWSRPSASSSRSWPPRRERAREADLLRFGVEEIEAVAPQPGEDLDLAAEEARLGHADTLRTAAEQAREALSSEQDSPDALGAVAAARGQLDSVREHDAEAGELADRVAEVTYLLSDLAADVASYASGIDTDPARLAGVSERRAALVSLTRKYGDSVDAVLAWGEQAASRLLELDATDETIERLTAARVGPARRAGRRGGGPDRRPSRSGRATRRRGDRGARPARDAGRQHGHPGRGARDTGTSRRRQPARRRIAGGRPLAPVPQPRGRRGRAAPHRQRRRPSRARCTRARRAVSCPG